MIRTGRLSHPVTAANSQRRFDQHVGNTLASNTGANLRESMTRMGHASPQAALIYQHATAERDRAIADALGAMIEDAFGAADSQNDDET